MLSEPVGNVNGSDLWRPKGYLMEERGMSYLTETDPARARAPASGGLHLPHRARAPGGARKY